MATSLSFASEAIVYPTLNVTAIAARNGSSVFECWALNPGFVQSTQSGTVGAQLLQMGNLANASFSILPANFTGGLHNAPAVQWVSFVSGLAHVTLPNSTAEAWVVGGPHGLIVATDTAAVSTYGHISVYPSFEETRTLQIPTAGGAIPGHTVLHDGPCDAAVQRKRAMRIMRRGALNDLD
ncbi:hypothetical protein FA95DRAFT_1581180 [Auriscalpium vulgare]|uniref:Uncharacterized protein n=1 Tax=Auriscalpium vulgare TaxID=40419 RepID=A0ACB8S3L2_9AGAM|nr:hypothetical protein FA95DRAFT_1581180 [Auriscalpium vulgare]